MSTQIITHKELKTIKEAVKLAIRDHENYDIPENPDAFFHREMVLEYKALLKKINKFKPAEEP